MNEHIKDRGTKKWTSIMLPEHVKALKQLLADERKEQKPLLDEQHLIEMDQKLTEAVSSGADVKMIVYSQFMKKKVIGEITAVQVGYVYIHHREESFKIALDSILDVEII